MPSNLNLNLYLFYYKNDCQYYLYVSYFLSKYSKYNSNVKYYYNLKLF